MKEAGIREARHNLSVLIDEVRKGREIVITERGKPVARLAPIEARSGKPFGAHARLRKRLPRIDPPLSAGIAEERDERI